MIRGIDKITSPPGALEAFIVFDRVFSQACSRNPKNCPGPATTFSVWNAIEGFPEIEGSSVIRIAKTEAKARLGNMENYRTLADYVDSRERLLDSIRSIYGAYIKEA